MNNMLYILENLFNMMKTRNRKGLDKPVFIVAAITLAIIFVSVYFASVSGWMDGALTQFSEESTRVQPQ